MFHYSFWPKPGSTSYYMQIYYPSTALHSVLLLTVVTAERATVARFMYKFTALSFLKIKTDDGTLHNLLVYKKMNNDVERCYEDAAFTIVTFD